MADYLVNGDSLSFVEGAKAADVSGISTRMNTLEGDFQTLRTDLEQQITDEVQEAIDNNLTAKFYPAHAPRSTDQDSPVYCDVEGGAYVLGNIVVVDVISTLTKALASTSQYTSICAYLDEDFSLEPSVENAPLSALINTTAHKRSTTVSFATAYRDGVKIEHGTAINFGHPNNLSIGDQVCVSGVYVLKPVG